MSLVWIQATRIADASNSDETIASMLEQTGTGWAIQLPIPKEAKKNSDTLANYIRNHAQEKRRDRA